jgi:hypothetical protein
MRPCAVETAATATKQGQSHVVVISNTHRPIFYFVLEFPISSPPLFGLALNHDGSPDHCRGLLQQQIIWRQQLDLFDLFFLIILADLPASQGALKVLLLTATRQFQCGSIDFLRKRMR